MWLLSSVTPLGWLNKMIQFMEKSRKTGDENVGVALLTYPVLMASDILLYQSDLVPVGDYQKQHLELTRELAERVNICLGEGSGRKWEGKAVHCLRWNFVPSTCISNFWVESFYDFTIADFNMPVPEALIPPTGARMSKSSPSNLSRINLLDSKNVIANKIKRCKTDSFPGLEFDNPERPECNNLLTIYQLVTGRTKECPGMGGGTCNGFMEDISKSENYFKEVALECQGMNWGTFKPKLTDALINHLHPIQTRYGEIISDQTYLDKVLSDGATNAAGIADTTLNNVYQAMGFLKR